MAKGVNSKGIKDSLEKQLKSKGADLEHFRGLINDYLWYEKMEKEMQKDIKKRGLSFEAISSTGKNYEKENPSIKQSILYSKQKLAILKQLDLTTSNVINEGEDEL